MVQKVYENSFGNPRRPKTTSTEILSWKWHNKDSEKFNETI